MTATDTSGTNDTYTKDTQRPKVKYVVSGWFADQKDEGTVKADLLGGPLFFTNWWGATFDDDLSPAITLFDSAGIAFARVPLCCVEEAEVERDGNGLALLLSDGAELHMRCVP